MRARVAIAIGAVVAAGVGVGYLAAAPSGPTARAGPAGGTTPTSRVAGHRGGTSPTTVVPTTATSVTTTTTAPPATTTTVTPGTLPQTTTVPSGQTAAFDAEMADLWQGVVDASVTPALPAFFPESAYAQLKAIVTAGGDWRNRLVHDFSLDISAAHRLLGATAAHATVTAVDVPESYAHWIGPGVCTNGIGYYEVPNTRVVYQEGGVTRSFGIASMISWRGQWYVVHFGAILRGTTTGSGEVDDPTTGPGSSAYSSTC